MEEEVLKLHPEQQLGDAMLPWKTLALSALNYTRGNILLTEILLFGGAQKRCKLISRG